MRATKLTDFSLLPTSPGNHIVHREVIEDVIRGLLLCHTLEPSWFGSCFLQRFPEV